jgi:hypothetical protein
MNKEEFHLDPDKRDWEYDGYGVKRYKDNYKEVFEEKYHKPVKSSEPDSE